MLTFVFLIFIGYLLVRLIFDFILPVYRTTQQVKKGFREMHQKMNGQQPGTTSPKHAEKSSQHKKAPASDYIDFEEVKD